MTIKKSNRKKTIRTSSGLCDALFDEFDMLRNGESDANRASAVAKLAVQIINTKRLEIDASALLNGSFNIKPVVFEGRGLRIGRTPQ